MATTKPRITITLNQRTYAVVKAISDLGGQPMSAFVAEMLDSALPTLERMAATFQAIKNAQTAERGKFLASMDRAQEALEPAVMEAVGQFDLFLGKIEAAVGVQTDATAGAPAARRRAPRSPGTGDPRLVTRGSTPPSRKKSAASTTATKPTASKALRPKP